jgi:hypothetical protein
MQRVAGSSPFLDVIYGEKGHLWADTHGRLPSTFCKSNDEKGHLWRERSSMRARACRRAAPPDPSRAAAGCSALPADPHFQTSSMVKKVIYGRMSCIDCKSCAALLSAATSSMGNNVIYGEKGHLCERVRAGAGPPPHAPESGPRRRSFIRRNPQLPKRSSMRKRSSMASDVTEGWVERQRNPSVERSAAPRSMGFAFRSTHPTNNVIYAGRRHLWGQRHLW